MSKHEWLTYGEVKRRIEACTGTDGKYLLDRWITGSEPLLPRKHIPGRKWAAYSSVKVDELLEPLKTEQPK